MNLLNPRQTGRIIPQMPNSCAWHMQRLLPRRKEDGSHEWYCPACEEEEAMIAAVVMDKGWMRKPKALAHHAVEVPFTTA